MDGWIDEWIDIRMGEAVECATEINKFYEVETAQWELRRSGCE